MAKAVDPYEAGVWCIGAADTLPASTRKKYAHKEADLAEKLAVLAKKKKEKEAA